MAQSCRVEPEEHSPSGQSRDSPHAAPSLGPDHYHHLNFRKAAHHRSGAFQFSPRCRRGVGQELIQRVWQRRDPREQCGSRLYSHRAAAGTGAGAGPCRRQLSPASLRHVGSGDTGPAAWEPKGDRRRDRLAGFRAGLVRNRPDYFGRWWNLSWPLVRVRVQIRSQSGTAAEILPMRLTSERLWKSILITQNGNPGNPSDRGDRVVCDVVFPFIAAQTEESKGNLALDPIFPDGTGPCGRHFLDFAIALPGSTAAHLRRLSTRLGGGGAACSTHAGAVSFHKNKGGA